MHRLIVEIAFHIEFVRYGLEPQKLTQCRERLNLGEVCHRKIALKLQELEFDLEQIALAHIPVLVARLADVYRLLEAFRILLRQVDGGLREQYRDKLLAGVK